MPRDCWPESWRKSFEYDQLEIYGHRARSGYARAYASRRAATLRLLTEAVPRGSSVLDVAAAQGNFSLALAELGYRVTWNDLRADLADYVRLKYETGSITFAPGNAFELAFAERFDAILATEVIEHVAHPDEFLRQLAGLVRPGGVLIVTTPNGAYFRNRLPRFSDIANPSALEEFQFQPDADGHLFLLHPDELRALAAAARLRVEAFILHTNSLSNGHLKLEPLLRVLPDAVVNGLERFTRNAPFGLARRMLTNMAVRLRAP